MKKYVCSTFILLLSLTSFAQNKDETSIKTMLKEQENAWNKGNINAFMHGYWENDSLLFIGKSGPKYGYKTTLENYKKSYPDTVQMGKLTTTILSMQKLSIDYYFVVGKWYLKRTVGDAGGHYTLLLRKIKGKWVIVADHSS
ncbi:MAG: YybH family protein [Chitinophagaceae bacterium]